MYELSYTFVMSFGQPREEQVIELWDKVFNALSAEPRRQLIGRLRDVSETNWVALPEGAQSPVVPKDDRALRLELVHHHLPLLADDRFVVWEDDPLRARQGPAFAEIGAVVTAVIEMAPTLPTRLVDGCPTLEVAADENR